jgi:hypothetical protein
MKALRALTQSLSLSVAAAIGLALASSATVADDLAAWSEAIPDRYDRFEKLPGLNFEASLDRETQLVWLREPKDQVASWDEARKYCLNQSIGARDNMRMGWRLPSVHELSTIAAVDWLDTHTPPFGRLADKIHFREWNELWTATSYAEDEFSMASYSASLVYGTTSDAVYAWVVSLDEETPEITPRRKDQGLGVVCVRGPFNSSQY